MNHPRNVFQNSASGETAFLIGMVEEDASEIQVLAQEGVDCASSGRLDIRQTTMSEVIGSGDPHFVANIDDLQVNVAAPAICIPLKIKEQVIGVIAIYKFLRQKKRLATLDHELFTLLAGHAETALFASKLYTDSKRKLNTIQGFIDLVSS